MSRWLQHPWHPGPVGQLGATDTSDNNVSPSPVIYWGSEIPHLSVSHLGHLGHDAPAGHAPPPLHLSGGRHLTILIFPILNSGVSI